MMILFEDLASKLLTSINISIGHCITMYNCHEADCILLVIHYKIFLLE